MQGLTVGRIVHYVCPVTQAHRAAIVVNVKDIQSGKVDLFVFGMSDDGGFFMRVDCIFNPSSLEETWHWTEPA